MAFLARNIRRSWKESKIQRLTHEIRMPDFKIKEVTYTKRIAQTNEANFHHLSFPKKFKTSLNKHFKTNSPKKCNIITFVSHC